MVVRKDEPKRETKGGIALPDAAEIPTITGRIVTISAQIENDEDVPLRQYDRILFHPKNAVPVDFEPDNQLFVVPVEDVVAVFRRRQQRRTNSQDHRPAKTTGIVPLLPADRLHRGGTLCLGVPGGAWGFACAASPDRGLSRLRIGEAITGRFFLAPHLYPLPRYSLRGGGEETIPQ